MNVTKKSRRYIASRKMRIALRLYKIFLIVMATPSPQNISTPKTSPMKKVMKLKMKSSSLNSNMN